MRAYLIAGLATAAFACGGNKITSDDDPNDGNGGKMDACVGLECQVVNCGAMSMPPTTLTGKVFAPNGTLPLYGANVYVPREELPPFTEGAQCSRCTDTLPGSPIVQATTNEAGEFRLENVPAGDNIPLVIALGKWRRKVTISTVSQCTDNPVAAAQTSLPKNKMEGDIPRIAVTTGDADALDCLLPKLGIDLAEMTNAGGNGRIHLYAGDGASSIQGGGTMSAAPTLWNDLEKLKQYDIVIFSCEGAQLPPNGTEKTQQALNNVKAYADLGGRVFLSHWHNVWISGKFQGGEGPPTQQVWKPIAEWANNGNPQPDTTTATIDEVSNPKGPSFATWMQNVMGSPGGRGLVPLTGYRKQAISLDPALAEQWVYLTNDQGGPSVQNFQFTTPLEVTSDQRCGKVVFSDMHVSADSDSRAGNPFPQDCSNAPLTPQEKALAFMFFDIATCVGGIF